MTSMAAYSLVTQGKSFIIRSIAAFLWLAMLSSHFYDPSLFHPVHHPEQLHNWAGILGALIGGSLIEVFGPIALLIPWFLIRFSTPDPTRPFLYKWYYPTMLILSVSILQYIMLPSFPHTEAPIFLLYPGYLGAIGYFWLHGTMGHLMTWICCGFIAAVSLIKSYHDLPISMIAYGAFMLLLAPLYAWEIFYNRFTPFVIGWVRLKVYQIRERIVQLQKTKAKLKQLNELNKEETATSEETLDNAETPAAV